MNLFVLTQLLSQTVTQSITQLLTQSQTQNTLLGQLFLIIVFLESEAYL
mgnify:FL=1